MKLLFDDPTTHVPDGYAVDFVRILVNPHKFKYQVSLAGSVMDADKHTPIAGATDRLGKCELTGLPAGLAIATAAAPEHDENSVPVEPGPPRPRWMMAVLPRLTNDEETRLSHSVAVDLRGGARASQVQPDLWEEWILGCSWTHKGNKSPPFCRVDREPRGSRPKLPSTTRTGT